MNDNQNIIDQNQFECSICLSVLRQPCTTSCGHTFCYTCIASSLLSVPKCPVCRFPLLQNTSYLKENILIKEIIEKRFPNLKNIQQQQLNSNNPIIQNTQSTTESKEIPATLIISLNQNVNPAGQQKIKLKQEQFKDIPEEVLKSFLTSAQVVFVNIGRNKLYSYQDNIEIYGVLVVIQSLSIDNGMIQIAFMGQERVLVNSIKNCQFKVNYQQDIHQNINEEEQKNEQQQLLMKDMVFEMQTCKGLIIQDQIINLNNPEIQQQLQSILQDLLNFLNRAININSQLDQSSMIVRSALQNTGILKFLNNGNLSNIDQISKFSILLGGVLKLPGKEKSRILTTTDIIERLLILNESVKRFNGIQNQLMIFDLDLPEHGSYSITNNLMVLIGVILAIYFFTLQKTK